MKVLEYWPALLAALPFISRFASVVRLLDLLGPFGSVVKVIFEYLANLFATIASAIFRSIYRVTFEPGTWLALLAFYFAGSFFPVQEVRVKVSRAKAAVSAPAPKVAAKASKGQKDTRSIIMRNFDPFR